MFNREKLQELSDKLHNPIVLPDWDFNMNALSKCVIGFANALGLNADTVFLSDIIEDRRTEEFIVAAKWYLIDNTREGAALRIDYLLENGVPTDFNPNDISTYKTVYK